MKKLVVVLSVLLTGCSYTVLTTKNRVVSKRLQNMTVSCGEINEWDVSPLRDDDKKTGCWCLMPAVIAPPRIAIQPFVLVPDEMCKE